jgi:hypothetical protein
LSTCEAAVGPNSLANANVAPPIIDLSFDIP